MVIDSSMSATVVQAQVKSNKIVISVQEEGKKRVADAMVKNQYNVTIVLGLEKYYVHVATVVERFLNMEEVLQPVCVVQEKDDKNVQNVLAQDGFTVRLVMEKIPLVIVAMEMV
jgi:hypothetical protein